MARLKAAGSTALTLIVLLLLAVPWITHYALYWSADDSVSLGIVTYFASLPIGGFTCGLIYDATHDYNHYRRAIDELHWDKHQQEKALIDQILQDEGLK